MTNESLWVKLIKRFYGVSGPLDEYKEKEITKIGNQAFIILYFLNLVSVGIWGILVTNGLDFEFAFNGLFFTILVEMVFLTDYVIILAKKKSLLDEEVSKQDYAKKLCKIKFESVGSGLIFCVLP